jgi:hypothetical protein
VTRRERCDREGHTAEDDRLRGEELGHNRHLIYWRLTWKGTGHVVGNEWTMTCGMDHLDGKRGDGQMSENEEGLKGTKALPHDG